MVCSLRFEVCGLRFERPHYTKTLSNVKLQTSNFKLIIPHGNHYKI